MEKNNTENEKEKVEKCSTQNVKIQLVVFSSLVMCFSDSLSFSELLPTYRVFFISLTNNFSLD